MTLSAALLILWVAVTSIYQYISGRRLNDLEEAQRKMLGRERARLKADSEACERFEAEPGWTCRSSEAYIRMRSEQAALELAQFDDAEDEGRG